MSARTDVEAEQMQNSSGVTPQSLEATLREKLEASHVEIVDMSGRRMAEQRSTLSCAKTYRRWMRSDV